LIAARLTSGRSTALILMARFGGPSTSRFTTHPRVSTLRQLRHAPATDNPYPRRGTRLRTPLRGRSRLCG
jgi:hypothetical protein